MRFYRTRSLDWFEVVCLIGVALAWAGLLVAGFMRGLKWVREDVYRRIKLEIDSPGHRDGLKKNKAAMLLNVSRQRVTQLYAAWRKKGAAKMEPSAAPVIVRPEPPAVPPAPLPGDLYDVLAPVGGATPVPPPVAPKAEDFTKIPDPSPFGTSTAAPGEQAEPVDPEDAAAGRDLVRWFVRGFKEGLARWVFKIKKDDPRMVDIREENEFLRISIKRNSEKAAPLGKLTKGPLGLLIGSALEAIKMAFVIEDTPDDIPATPFKEVTPRSEDVVFKAVPDDAPARKMTMDEKIAAANKAAGIK